MSGNATSQKWHRQRVEVVGMRDRWLALMRQSGFEGVSIGILPDSAPPESSNWNWWVTFVVGDTEFDALIGDRLAYLAFENDRGVFEDEVPTEDVPSYLIGRLQKI